MNDTFSGRSLFGKTRQAVLSLLYGRSETAFYTKQILDFVKSGRGTVQRELQNLTNSGIIRREVKGRQVYYQANDKNPIFNELQSLATKFADAPEVNKIGKVDPRFPLTPAQLDSFCRKHHIKKLSLFGSVLRDDFRPDSDIDVLVEFELGFVPGFDIIGIQNELAELTGRTVDLRTAGDLSRYFRDSVVAEARVKYATK